MPPKPAGFTNRRVKPRAARGQKPDDAEASSSNSPKPGENPPKPAAQEGPSPKQQSSRGGPAQRRSPPQQSSSAPSSSQTPAEKAAPTGLIKVGEEVYRDPVEGQIYATPKNTDSLRGWSFPPIPTYNHPEWLAARCGGSIPKWMIAPNGHNFYDLHTPEMDTPGPWNGDNGIVTMPASFGYDDDRHGYGGGIGGGRGGGRGGRGGHRGPPQPREFLLSDRPSSSASRGRGDRGRGDRGGRGRGGMGRGGGDGVCRSFQETGNCRFGDSCRFKHA
ncbi:hypothetical protein EX30DRAFT_366024 [Ascodesmis nigricans]|uniref:C3H1-type domain-containing protein n=1 Tax=Ascodesmis nigricans TaxID=341454 RepID=A0A4S2MRC5_9PEZI|nr:hypothetical protein EX30DRAFT_366024 [Ascodesmis nigricans]